jgi:hypothetical protein
VITIRVVDSTATGAAQLADSVMLASDQVVARQQARKVAEQLRSTEGRCELENTLANDVVEPAGRPNDDRLRNKCDAATTARLREARRRLLLQIDAAAFNLLQRAAVPEQPHPAQTWSPDSDWHAVRTLGICRPGVVAYTPKWLDSQILDA